MMNQTASQRRWACALHEAAHLETARAMNLFNCSCHAALLPGDDGGGLAQLPAGLTAWKCAVAIAAGEIGGKLAARYPIPKRRHTDPPLPVESGNGGEDILPGLVRWAMSGHSDAVASASDDEHVARWCIAGHEAAPHEWARRHRRVKAAARLEVWRVRNQIHQTARALYLNGAVHLPGNPDEDAVFPHGAELKTKTQEP